LFPLGLTCPPRRPFFRSLPLAWFSPSRLSFLFLFVVCERDPPHVAALVLSNCFSAINFPLCFRSVLFPSSKAIYPHRHKGFFHIQARLIRRPSLADSYPHTQPNSSTLASRQESIPLIRRTQFHASTPARAAFCPCCVPPASDRVGRPVRFFVWPISPQSLRTPIFIYRSPGVSTDPSVTEPLSSPVDPLLSVTDPPSAPLKILCRLVYLQLSPHAGRF